MFPPDIQPRARRKLVLLDEAEDLEDLRRTPGNRLEASGETALGSIASASTTSGESASPGMRARTMRKMWKS
jgi:hypothetical protein